MPIPATFIEYLAEMPGMERFALGMYERIDTYALLVASRYLADGRTAETFRALAAEQLAQAETRTGPWLENFNEAERNQWRADTAALDPRLILRPELWAWSRRQDLNLYWVEYYLDMLEAYARKRAAEASPANDNADVIPALRRALAEV